MSAAAREIKRVAPAERAENLDPDLHPTVYFPSIWGLRRRFAWLRKHGFLPMACYLNGDWILTPNARL